MRRRPGRVAPVPDEIALHPRRVGPRPLRRASEASDRGQFAVEVDQLLGDRLAFRRIGVQQRGRAPPAQHRRELPSQIEGILHRDVHPLPGLRAVGVARVAGDEHARQPRRGLFGRHVVELVGHPLPDLVDRPPGDLLHLQPVGAEDRLRPGDELVERDVAAGDALADVELGELDVEPKEIAALARDDEHAARHGRTGSAHLQRMSGKSVTASTSITPQAWLAESPCSSRPIEVRTVLRAPSQPTT